MSKVVSVPTPTELVEFIVRAFVDSPAHVSVEEVSNQFMSILYLRVDAADLGKVIGKQGEMARALRDILQAQSAKLKRQYILLKVIENSDADLPLAV